MGLRDKYAKKIAEQGFRPLELCEENVQVIFNRCLATKEDAYDDIVLSILFQRSLGYDKDSMPVSFHEGRIKENKKNILYLLGQLKAVQEDIVGIITSATAVYRYDDVEWTTDIVKIMELFHLGEAIHVFQPFTKASNSATILPALVGPTLSPRDPKFPAWWEAHKAQWE